MSVKALIFDCDGVLVDTERDGHRVAFNEAFNAHGLDIVWEDALYKKLLQTGGGKERMRAYFNEYGWPEGASDRDALIIDLHKTKSEIFLKRIEEGALAPRPGVARLMDEAREAGVKLAVCSTSKLESVEGCLRLYGHRYDWFEFILAGDMVSRKKPDPEIYNNAKERLGLRGEDCLVVEDSEIGCAAAVAAGCRVLVTMSAYTHDEDFTGAERVVSEIGEIVSLADFT